MKLNICILILFFCSMLLSITLQECFQKLEISYPTARNDEIYQKILQEEVSALNRNWLPQLNLTSSYVYNSETTEIDIDFPPTMDLDLPAADNQRMAVSLEFNQQIYDWNRTGYQKQQKQQESRLNVLKEEATIQYLKIYTAALFLSIKMLQKHSQILSTQQQNLQITLNGMKARESEGMVEPGELDLIRYEILTIQDDLARLNMQTTTARSKLSRICGIESAEELEIPEITRSEITAINRAELKSFMVRNQLMEVNKKLIRSRQYPLLRGFGNLSFGKPGYDLFSTDPHFYYSAGVKLQWNFWDFGKNKKVISTLSYQQQRIQAEKNKFLLELDNQKDEIDNEIFYYSERIKISEEKMGLIRKIDDAYAAKLKEGIISSSEYLLQSNKLINSQMEYEGNKLNLLNVRIRRILLLGGEI